MRPETLDLLKIDSGTITAPAGCGKTHLIADALMRHRGDKPILVLTHTNAGVAALRERLRKAGAPASTYRLTTIDGWAMRLVQTFPQRSEVNLEVLKLEKPASDYPSIRRAAVTLLKKGHVNEILKASYSRLIVDEYQDCSKLQHAVVYVASQVLPTCALGDPLQAIFGFGSDELADWDEHVCKHFPIAGELATPWRWKNAEADELGHWLLEVRKNLLNRKPVDLSTAPAGVSWVQLDKTSADFNKCLEAAKVKAPTTDGCVLIIGDSKNSDSRFKVASMVHGAVTVEAVDLRDLVAFAKKFDLKSVTALEDLAWFAQSVMSNVGAADLIQRVKVLKGGKARKPPNDVEKAALSFVANPNYSSAGALLEAIGADFAVRCYRPAVLRACFRALQLCNANPDLKFEEAVLQMREQNRALGRPLPKRAVGSTLLLKGLEADVAVILNADQLDARNLYVAMTRGSKNLVICSASQVLNPHAN